MLRSMFHVGPASLVPYLQLSSKLVAIALQTNVRNALAFMKNRDES